MTDNSYIPYRIVPTVVIIYLNLNKRMNSKNLEKNLITFAISKYSNQINKQENLKIFLKEIAYQKAKIKTNTKEAAYKIITQFKRF